MAQALREIPRADAAQERSNLGDLPELFKQLAGDVTEMATARVELLKVEMKQEAANVVSSAAGVTAGGSIALTGFVFGSLALVFVIAQAFLQNAYSSAASYALALGIVGVPYLIVGMIVVSVMKKRLARG